MPLQHKSSHAHVRAAELRLAQVPAVPGQPNFACSPQAVAGLPAWPSVTASRPIHSPAPAYLFYVCRVAFLGSTTSSVIAEASAPDHDTYSLDGISVAESEAERQGFEWWVSNTRNCTLASHTQSCRT